MSLSGICTKTNNASHRKTRNGQIDYILTPQEDDNSQTVLNLSPSWDNPLAVTIKQNKID